MEQAESNMDSLRVFTREKWFVQLGMAARGIACCSKCGTSSRIVMQVPAFKLTASSRVTGHSEIIPVKGTNSSRIVRRCKLSEKFKPTHSPNRCDRNSSAGRRAQWHAYRREP